MGGTSRNSWAGASGTVLLAVALVVASSACGSESLPPQREPRKLVLEGISPPSAFVGASALTVHLYGRGFVPSDVVLADEEVLASTYVNEGHVQAVLMFAHLQATRAIKLALASLAGPRSNQLELAVVNPRPTVEAVVPDEVPYGVSRELTITGRDFVRSSRVWLGDHEVQASFVDPATLTTTPPASVFETERSLGVRVENPPPGGGSSTVGARIHTRRRPVILGSSPHWVREGAGALTVTVHGTGFGPGSVVSVDGLPRPTIVLEHDRLRFNVSAAETASQGAVAFIVSNTNSEEVSLPGWLTVLPAVYGITSSTVIEMPSYRVVHDEVRSRLYVNRQGAGEIVALDADTGTPVGSVSVAFETEPMAVTDDGQFLYVGYRSRAGIVRIDLDTLTPVLEVPIEGLADPDDVTARIVPEDIATVPGAPHKLLVAVNNNCCSPRTVGVVLFTDGTRTDPIGVGGALVVTSASTVYVVGQGGGFTRLGIVGNDLVVEQTGDWDTLGETQTSAGYMISSYGHLVEPIAMVKRQSQFLDGSSSVAADRHNGRIHFKRHEETRLTVLHHLSLVELGSLDLPDALWQGRSMVRVGPDGLAIAGGRFVGIIRSRIIGG